MEQASKMCSTLGCQAVATHELTWHGPDGESTSEPVCEEDGMMYTYRPSLRATLKPLVGE